MSATYCPEPTVGMPPLRSLQISLRKITETLANELARPSATAPEWSELEWLLARAVAAVHGVSPLLSHSLRWQGPPGWRRFLDDQRMHTYHRHARIRDLLISVDDAGREAGIPLVALKGVALHEMQLYSPGDRPMADIDLLVREPDSQRAARMLEQLGFRVTHTTRRHQVFAAGAEAAADAFGENFACGMKIELHSQIREVLPLHSVDVTACVFPGTAEPGLNDYPSRAALMTHLLLHAAGAMALRVLRLLHLNDISRLSASMSGRDWDEFLAQESVLDKTLWWSFPLLAMTARYYDSIPEHVIAATSRRCRWLLKRTCRRRTLSDVSLSYLWVTAFPGIEWASSPSEMLTYMMRRIAPNAEVRSIRKALAKTEPALAHSTWAHLSQRRRVLRWLISPPTRAEALRPIQMTLAQTH
jgi:hypothetical protein